MTLATAFPAAARAPRPSKPLVLAHRGASALRPEHTLASYAKAIQDGADFVEPDLVATKDGVLVARHENEISETTNVADHAEFAARKTTKTIDGQALTGWFTEDFNLAELKTLRAKERLGLVRPEGQAYDGQFQIVTFDEIADFVAAEAAARGRTIGLIPEIKHSTYFAGIGLPLEPRFLDAVRAHGYLRYAPLIVQSFETENLKALRPQIAEFHNIQLLQLVEPSPRAAAMLTPAGLATIATYADWLSPYSRLIIPTDADGKLGTPTGLVEAAHRAGLLVSAWTFRPENRFLPADLRDGAGDSARNPRGSLAEMRRYIAAGLDALFTDDPALGREAVDKT